MCSSDGGVVSNQGAGAPRSPSGPGRCGDLGVAGSTQMQGKQELQGVQADRLGAWVTLDEVGGNLDAVQPRSAGPGVVPSASQAAVAAALFSGVRAWNPPAVVPRRSSPASLRAKRIGLPASARALGPF